jgi:hypothetical protein
MALKRSLKVNLQVGELCLERPKIELCALERLLEGAIMLSQVLRDVSQCRFRPFTKL